jgi:hypothetical protein
VTRSGVAAHDPGGRAKERQRRLARAPLCAAIGALSSTPAALAPEVALDSEGPSVRAVVARPVGARCARCRAALATTGAPIGIALIANELINKRRTVVAMAFAPKSGATTTVGAPAQPELAAG